MDQETRRFKLSNLRSMTSHSNQIRLGDEIRSTTLIQTQFSLYSTTISNLCAKLRQLLIDISFACKCDGR
jgi:hypothetical protein